MSKPTGHLITSSGQHNKKKEKSKSRFLSHQWENQGLNQDLICISRDNSVPQEADNSNSIVEKHFSNYILWEYQKDFHFLHTFTLNSSIMYT